MRAASILAPYALQIEASCVMLFWRSRNFSSKEFALSMKYHLLLVSLRETRGAQAVHRFM